METPREMVEIDMVKVGLVDLTHDGKTADTTTGVAHPPAGVGGGGMVAEGVQVQIPTALMRRKQSPQGRGEGVWVVARQTTFWLIAKDGKISSIQKTPPPVRECTTFGERNSCTFG